MQFRGGTLVVLLALAAHARAATFIDYTVGADYGFDGFHRHVSSADGSVTASRYGDGQRFLQIYFTPNPGSDETFAYVHLAPPAGESLAVGTYEHATQTETSAAYLEAGPPRGTCGNGPGRFTVHEVSFDQQGALATLSVDFEQVCSDGSTITGAARYRTGDGDCGGQDGAPCDDGDPCTTGDVCTAGACRGDDTVTSTCTAAGPCAVGSVCDRASGGCRPIERQNGVVCDDGDACRSDTVCRQGACGDGTPISCNDRSRCTTDRCDPAQGCVADALPGRCLVAFADVRAVATASAGGRSVVCKLRCAATAESTLFLYEDDTYRILGGTVTSCPTSNLVTYPDEVGAVASGRRSRFRLVASNADELRQAAQDCTGSRKLPRVAGMTLHDLGPEPLGRTVVRSTRVQRGIPVHTTVSTQYRFRDGVVDGVAVHPASFALPECGPGLSARCRTR